MSVKLFDGVGFLECIHYSSGDGGVLGNWYIPIRFHLNIKQINKQSQWVLSRYVIMMQTMSAEKNDFTCTSDY